jgi:hypothetical protein
LYTIGDGEKSLDEAGPAIISATRAVTLMLTIIAGSTLFLWGALINSTVI